MLGHFEINFEGNISKKIPKYNSKFVFSKVHTQRECEITRLSRLFFGKDKKIVQI